MDFNHGYPSLWLFDYVYLRLCLLHALVCRLLCSMCGGHLSNSKSTHGPNSLRERCGEPEQKKFQQRVRKKQKYDRMRDLHGGIQT